MPKEKKNLELDAVGRDLESTSGISSFNQWENQFPQRSKEIPKFIQLITYKIRDKPQATDSQSFFVLADRYTL